MRRHSVNLAQEFSVSQGRACSSADGVHPSLARLPAVLGAGLAAALLWIYGPTLADMAGRWGSEAQYSHGFLDSPVLTRPALDVVNGNAGEHKVEAAVSEWQRGHVGGAEPDPLGDSLGDGVPPCRLGPVTRLVCFPPEIDPDRAAGRQTPSGG